jgi:hypothetical protein
VSVPFLAWNGLPALAATLGCSNDLIAVVHFRQDKQSQTAVISATEKMGAQNFAVLVDPWDAPVVPGAGSSALYCSLILASGCRRTGPISPEGMKNTRRWNITKWGSPAAPSPTSRLRKVFVTMISKWLLPAFR